MRTEGDADDVGFCVRSVGADEGCEEAAREREVEGFDMGA